MAALAGLLAALVAVAPLPPGIVCDGDTDCLYVPSGVESLPPGLLILHCNGALPVDLDSFRLVGDSLGWVLGTCHATRNHRDMMLNDRDVVRSAAKLLERGGVDPARLFVFGFSGQAVQALAAVFLHPELFRGAVATCAHAGAMGLFVPELAGDRLFELVTREQDWNRADNERMYRELRDAGIAAELVTTPGEHGPGPWRELLEACRRLARSLPAH